MFYSTSIIFQADAHSNALYTKIAMDIIIKVVQLVSVQLKKAANIRWENKERIIY